MDGYSKLDSINSAFNIKLNSSSEAINSASTGPDIIKESFTNWGRIAADLSYGNNDSYEIMQLDEHFTKSNLIKEILSLIGQENSLTMNYEDFSHYTEVQLCKLYNLALNN